MKKFLYLSVSLFVVCGLFFSICSAQVTTKSPDPTTPKWQTKEVAERNFNQNPVELLNTVTQKSNLYYSEKVQNTALNGVNSNSCDDAISVGSNFTLTRTLCSIKQGIRPYLQYIIWAWLTGATILLIRNGFLLVTSTDRWKQIWVFKKNIIYIVVWVALIISFYWILDIFVSLINFIAE